MGGQKKKSLSLRTVIKQIKASVTNKSTPISPLDLSVGGGSFREPSATDGVDLVHEDDARLVIASVSEHFADQPVGTIIQLTNIRLKNIYTINVHTARLI